MLSKVDFDVVFLLKESKEKLDRGQSFCGITSGGLGTENLVVFADFRWNNGVDETFGTHPADKFCDLRLCRLLSVLGHLPYICLKRHIQR